MIHTGNQLPRLLFTRYPTFLSNINEHVLIPGRSAAFMFNTMALLTCANYRHELIVRSSLLPGYDDDDYRYMLRIADGAISVYIICLVLLFLSFVSARTLRFQTLAFLHFASHLVGGILLLMIWAYDSHVMRLWHVWYFFCLPVTTLELGCWAWTFFQGTIAS